MASTLEPFGKMRPDKGEGQCGPNGRVAKLVGNSRKPGIGKRDGGIGKFADVCKLLQNMLSSLSGTFGNVPNLSIDRSGGELRLWLFFTIPFRRDGWLGCVCVIRCNAC
jgi:hypothetical protein